MIGTSFMYTPTHTPTRTYYTKYDTQIWNASTQETVQDHPPLCSEFQASLGNARENLSQKLKQKQAKTKI